MGSTLYLHGSFSILEYRIGFRYHNGLLKIFSKNVKIPYDYFFGFIEWTILKSTPITMDDVSCG